MCQEIQIEQHGKFVEDITCQGELERIVPVKYWSADESYQNQVIAFSYDECLCPLDLAMIANRLNIQHRIDWEECPWGPTWNIDGCEGEADILESILKLKDEKEAKYKEYLARKASSSS